MLWCRTNTQDPNAKPFHVRTSVSEATSIVCNTSGTDRGRRCRIKDVHGFYTHAFIIELLHVYQCVAVPG